MSILEIKNLTHSYESKILFSDANLTFNNGEHAGVVGLNGAGKSTFIKILTGEVVQDAGEVRWLSGISRGYLDQHADIDRTQTVMEYLKSSFAPLFEKNSRMERLYTEMETVESPDVLEKMINKANAILDELTTKGFFEIEPTIKKVGAGLGIDKMGYDTPVSQLSGGGRAKLMLCKLLLEKPTVMLLDEPTNFLDVEHVAWLEEYLNGIDNSFLVISHDEDFLNKVTRCIFNIENGSIKKYNGNYAQFLVQREQNAKQYEESYVRQQREIERMTEYIERNKARAATAGMANSRKKQLEKIEVLRKPTVVYDAVFSFPFVALHTKEIVGASDLVIGYGSPLLPPISFSIDSETKMWIRGTNGIGKTTLLKTLLGKMPALGGRISFHPACKISYLEQDLEFPFQEQTPSAYLSDFYPRYNQKQLRASLAAVGIKNELAVKRICEMSGGEQVRLKLAVMSGRESNLLILDEPTNHLDVRAKESLKKAISEYNGAVILVSHEKDFGESVCDKIFDVRM